MSYAHRPAQHVGNEAKRSKRIESMSHVQLKDPSAVLFTLSSYRGTVHRKNQARSINSDWVCGSFVSLKKPCSYKEITGNSFIIFHQWKDLPPHCSLPLNTPYPGSFSECCDNLGWGHDSAFVHFMMTCVYCQQYLPWAALSDGVGYVYRHNAEFGDGKLECKSVYFEYSLGSTCPAY